MAVLIFFTLQQYKGSLGFHKNKTSTVSISNLTAIALNLGFSMLADSKALNHKLLSISS